MAVPQIIIIGGGFGGLYTARHLQSLLSQTDAQVTLVSKHNYFLMTPLLFEAGSGVLESRHAVSPIRTLFRDNTRVRFVQADVTGVDFDRKVVTAQPPGNHALYELEYSHLVIALGGITNTNVIPGADKVMTFKSLADAVFLRNHAIELFERADIETDPDRRARLLTFVVAGGGLVGVELAGELSEFLLHVSRLYPRVDPKQIRIELIEYADRIMPEMDTSLAAYAVKVLEKHGVKVRTGTKVEKIEHPSGYHSVHLAGGLTIDATTVVIATGVKVNPLVDDFPLEKDKRGRLLTDATMRCKNRENVWAIGDCANIPDPDGKPYPQLAQHALREARVLAANLRATLRNQPLKPFIYKTIGVLAALGHFTGVGQIRKFRFRGFFAWWIWRSYYLLQMPRWSRRVRIVFDWTIALLFKNDVVELDLWGERHMLQETINPFPKDPQPPGGPKELLTTAGDR